MKNEFRNLIWNEFKDYLKEHTELEVYKQGQMRNSKNSCFELYLGDNNIHLEAYILIPGQKFGVGIYCENSLAYQKVLQKEYEIKKYVHEKIDFYYSPDTSEAKSIRVMCGDSNLNIFSTDKQKRIKCYEWMIEHLCNLKNALTENDLLKK